MVAAIRSSILQDETFAGYEVSGPEATCVSEATVTGVGVERLTEIGFDDDAETADEVDLRRLTDEEVDVVGSAMGECIDDVEAVLVDTVAASIIDDPEPALPVDEEAAACVAEAVVGEIPPGRLIAIGVRGDRTGDVGQLRPAEVDVFATAYTDCIDVRSVLLEGIESAGTASGDVLACLDDGIADADIETIFRAGLAGEDAAATARRLLSPVVESCTAR
ncbi:MAG TPA: hypothetical protein VFV42_07865 [Acidimicrobiales bacterium]|nr:hypothetical protein [Acidimicrobiales bacterium]